MGEASSVQAPEHDVERRAAEGTEQGGIRDAPPELLECRLGAVRAAFGVAADEDGGVHGAGGSAGNAVDLEPWFVEEPVEDAPRVKAPCAPPPWRARSTSRGGPSRFGVDFLGTPYFYPD